GVLGTAADTNLITGLIMCSANLPDKVAISIDSQMDDGNGKAGTVRATKQTQPNMSLTAKAAADAYSEDGVSTYVVCRQM
ncbi:MAG: hypothetical protein ACT4P4_22195, partial [Betaproteobacteria bacterium]